MVKSEFIASLDVLMRRQIERRAVGVASKSHERACKGLPDMSYSCVHCAQILIVVIFLYFIILYAEYLT